MDETKVMRAQGRLKLNPSVSVIIPTIKKTCVTLNSLECCPVPHQLILSLEHGLGYARNYGAKQARNSLLVFLDDDVILKKEIWNSILTTHEGEFKMTKYDDSNLPSSRIMAIHSEDFWRVGGFDESVKFNGEDKVFYLEAMCKGLKFKEIPTEYVTHVPHDRWQNKRDAMNRILDTSRNFVRYGFNYKSPKAFFGFTANPKMRLRSIVIRVFALLYYILKETMINVATSEETSKKKVDINLDESA